LSLRNALRSALLGEVPYANSTERNGTRLVLARGNSLANSAAVAPDAGTLASRAIHLNKERGSGIREEAIRDTLCTGVTLLT
jgi:hypothetical protein